MRQRNTAVAALLFTLILTVLALSACGGPSTTTTSPAQATSPTIPATPEPTATPQPTATAEPTATIEPSATPPPTETPTPSPTPQTVTLVVAPEFEAETAAALVGVDYVSHRWQLIVEDDPAAILAEGRADLAIARGTEGTLVREEPLAFMVPFTYDWEQISAADAEAILANGHSLIRVVPWSAMTPDNKAMRVDGLHPTDPDYSYREYWSLVAAPGYEEAAAALAPLLSDALAPLPTIRIAAVGDINYDRSPAYIIQTTGDLAYPLSRVAHIFEAADYTIANLETALGDVGEPAAKRYPFRSPPETAESLA
ncbi:MAG TPA: CapA family protein, partial [Promineifilum sp.]|nr:CapA family protein [Promineifilum sp.]